MPKQTFFNLPPDKRQLIIEIAIEEFAENDYENASISRIVASAQIAKGSFYQYFENKEALYRYLLDLGLQQKAQFLDTASPDPEMDMFAYLRWLAQAGVRFELTNPKLSQIGYRAVRSDTLPDSFRQQARQGAQAFFAQLVAQGKRQGDIAVDIDEDLAAFIFNVIFTELGAYMLQRLTVKESPEPAGGRSLFDSPEARAIFDQALRILESGMRRQQKEIS